VSLNWKGAVVVARRVDYLIQVARRPRAPYGFDIVQDRDVQRMVPNVAEQAVIERMKAMRASGATYSQIGGEVGMFGRTVQRILERASR
jgi:hypothetical protein